MSQPISTSSINQLNSTNSIDDEWNKFKLDSLNGVKPQTSYFTKDESNLPLNAPECSDLHISTKTVIASLNKQIDLNLLFWNIKTIKYWMPIEGILKKEILFTFSNSDDLKKYQQSLTQFNYYSENIKKHVDDPTSSKISFLDTRKLTVGFGAKELTTRIKSKGTIYNSISLLFRIFLKENNHFHETHVKLFNTGKIELPGVANIELLNLIKIKILEFLDSILPEKLHYIDINKKGVIINSDFKCGYFIDRKKANKLFKEKYKLFSDFDSSQYQGVKIKYYYNNNQPMDFSIQTGLVQAEDRIKISNLEKMAKYTKISISVFRTGSCLISGNCTDEQLEFVYEFMKKMFKDNYLEIRVPTKFNTDEKPIKDKVRHKLIKVFSNNLNIKLYDFVK